MDESLSSTSGSTASSGGVDGALVNTHDIDLVTLGADPTGQQDSTAAVQAALDLAMAHGAGTIIVPPKSHIRCDGQLVARADAATSSESKGMSPGQGSE